MLAPKPLVQGTPTLTAAAGLPISAHFSLSLCSHSHNSLLPPLAAADAGPSQAPLREQQEAKLLPFPIECRKAWKSIPEHVVVRKKKSAVGAGVGRGAWGGQLQAFSLIKK